MRHRENKIWKIDHSAGRPILTLNGCSVIEAEDAEYVLELIRRDRAAPTEDVRAVGEEPVAVRDFANELISAAYEGGAFDAGDIQDLAVKHGLLSIEPRAETCGEACRCSEYGFPTECLRKTSLLKPAQ